MNNNNNILMIIFIFCMTIGILYVGGNALKDKITKEVIEELKRDYAPGPYSPGFDPDKVNPNNFRNPQPQPQPLPQQNQNDIPEIRPADLPSPREWNRMWETQRFNSK